MKIYEDIDLVSFDFWSGAKDRAKVLTDDQMDTIQAILEEEDYEDKGYSDTYINDLFWFEEDWIAEMLGFSSFEELERANSGEDEFVDHFESIEPEMGDDDSYYRELPINEYDE